MKESWLVVLVSSKKEAKEMWLVVLYQVKKAKETHQYH